MSIENKTVLTPECLLEYNKRHLAARRPFLITICSIGAAATIAGLLLHFLGPKELYDPTSVTLLCGMLFLFGYLILRQTLLFKRSITKNHPSLGTESIIRFEEEHMEVTSTAKDHESHSTVSYTGITRVTESEHAIYLYLNRFSALIVGKEGFTEGSLEEFRTLIQTKVPPKKIRWK